MAMVELSRSDEWELEHDSQDVRGWEVVDGSGQRLGTVRELIIDTDKERVASLVLDSGEQVAAREVTLGDHVVRLDGATGSIGTSTESMSRTSVESTSERTSPELMSERGEERLPIIEEELRIGKRRVETGGVRVESRVEERPVEEEVRLREERVTVERQPADREVTDRDIANLDGRSIEVTESAEEAIVDKRARVVEEVVVKKDVDERTETIRETLRNTDVDVENIEGRDIDRTSVMPPSSIEDPSLRESSFRESSRSESRESGSLDSGSLSSSERERLERERIERERRQGGSLDSPSSPSGRL
jgi:uncharacterized protein (TIGR02271 family)